MYDVVVSPQAGDILIEFAAFYASTHGELQTERLIKAYENAVASLKFMPQRGTNNITDIPDYYRTIPFWKHLWLIYQINEESHTVLIDYVIDERSNYGLLID